MQTDHKKQKAAGFTLIEFLIVITVIGVVGGFVFSFGKKVFNRVYVFCDTTKLRYLAAFYMDAAGNGRLDLMKIKTAKDFAIALAEVGGPNEISAYQSKARKSAREKEILVNGEPNPELDEEDFDFIFVNPKCDNGSRTPLFYTRGLQSDGTWREDGVYGSRGGIIIFTDMHTEFMNKVDGDLLRVMRYRNGGSSPLFLPTETSRVSEGIRQVHVAEHSVPHQEVRRQEACHRKIKGDFHGDVNDF